MERFLNNNPDLDKKKLINNLEKILLVNISKYMDIKNL